MCATSLTGLSLLLQMEAPLASSGSLTLMMAWNWNTARPHLLTNLKIFVSSMNSSWKTLYFASSRNGCILLRGTFCQEKTWLGITRNKTYDPRNHYPSLRKDDSPPQGIHVDPLGILITFLGELLPFPREHITIIDAFVLWKVGHCSSCMEINFNISFNFLEFPIGECILSYCISDFSFNYLTLM